MMRWEEPEGEDKLPSHCQGWFLKSEKLEIQGGGFVPWCQLCLLTIHKRISGTYLWLKSFEVAGCKVTGCEELEKNKVVFLSDTSYTLHTVSPEQLIGNGLTRAQIWS